MSAPADVAARAARRLRRAAGPAETFAPAGALGPFERPYLRLVRD